MPPISLTPSKTKDAEHHLGKVDVVMRELIKHHGPCALSQRRSPPFHSLAWSVIGQQLSSKAASAILMRVSEVVSVPIRHTELLTTPPEKLRSAGLSMRKAHCLIKLAERVESGELNFASLHRKTDERVIESLTMTSGIGRWTAEMFLIFGLGRSDVLSLGDAGLQRATMSLYGSDARLEEVGKAWAPWRSVASWYLWRHLDNQ